MARTLPSIVLPNSVSVPVNPMYFIGNAFRRFICFDGSKITCHTTLKVE